VFETQQRVSTNMNGSSFCVGGNLPRTQNLKA
jgi:hypothetical protein